MPDFAKKPGGILVGIMSSSKKPPRRDDDEPTIPRARGSSPAMEEDEEEEGGSPLTPEERGSLGDDLNSSLKSGDGVAIFDAMEAIVRACKESY